MPSDLKKKKQLQKRAKNQSKDQKKKENDDGITENGVSSRTNGTGDARTNGAGPDMDEVMLASELGDLNLEAQHRSVTGVLASHPDSRDVHINGLTLTFHGAELLTETSLELNCGRRYGLIGSNGCGKSNLLSALSAREVPVPEHIDIFHVKREMPPSSKTAIQCVMEVEKERIRLEKEAEELALKDSDEAADLLQDIYARLETMDASTAEPRAAEILCGLGFTAQMQVAPVSSFSGGWRMRLALARALFIQPSMLLLDEPTNHLDLEACVWLERYLKTYGRILVVISHSQDFMNGICTNIIHMTKKRLKTFGGNYDSFIQTRSELAENQMKRYKWEQDQIAHMKEYIARFGHGSAKLAKQAQSKEKTLKKMVDAGLTEKVSMDKSVTFYFPDCGKIPPPVIQVQNVSFQYAEDKPIIYKNLEFGVDLDSRIALVGPNGAGKSTLLKLIAGELVPTDGIVRIHSHLRMGRYHQHLQEQLDLKLSAVEWMMKEYPDIKDRDVMRRNIGKYGLSGQQQVCPMKNLSDGQRCRVIFAWLAGRAPHLLLLDEPTNHLDMETIDALAEAINEFEGGLLLVSHDFRLINQVASDIWVCEKQTVTKWEGTIFDYKVDITKRLEKEEKRRNKQTK